MKATTRKLPSSLVWCVYIGQERLLDALYVSGLVPKLMKISKAHVKFDIGTEPKHFELLKQ